MSKYDPLWNYIRKRNEDELKLTYSKVFDILGFNIDHSFLTYKKELISYGFEVDKISMKNETIIFKRIKN